MTNAASHVGLVSALVDLRVGSLLSEAGNDDAGLVLEDLAAATPELFATDRVSWEIIFRRLQARDGLPGFQDIVLVSSRHVYVVLRSAHDRYLGLVSVAPHTRNVGLVLREARARLCQFEAEQRA